MMSEPPAGQLLVAPESASSPAATDPTPAGPGFAVLELFTSEGCSSCPPADENLATIAAEAERTGARVFTLELHVDYWNYLGWSDPFSDAIHSARQGAYARRFAGSGTYTPQLVVNGREELVGSNRAGARAAIGRALARPATANVSFSARQHAASLEIDAHVSSPKAGDLLLAVAEDQAETRVTRGENADRRLSHRHVVRAFRSVAVKPMQDVRWEVPWPAGRSAPFIAAYLTDPETLAVIGADAKLVPR